MSTSSTPLLLACTAAVVALNLLLLARACILTRRIGRQLDAWPPRRALSAVHSAQPIEEVEPAKVPTAHHSWSEVDWPSVRLRTGPDYNKHRRKAPTAEPLLRCVHVSVSSCQRKAYVEASSAHEAYLLPKVVAAFSAQTALPEWLVMCVHVPTTSTSSGDGPGFRYVLHFAVPPALAHGGGAAEALLRRFLEEAASGHADPSSDFYDRLKVIVRLRHLDIRIGGFLRSMVDLFNGKPMLWRFFGAWGKCSRRGAVVIVNMDMQTGGRIKNSAFARGVQSGYHHMVFDVAWTLEGRTDSELPERLLGGVTICRLDTRALPTLVFDRGAWRHQPAG